MHATECVYKLLLNMISEKWHQEKRPADVTERTSRRVDERYQPWQALALQSVAGAEIGYRLRGVGDLKSETGCWQEAEVYYVDPRS
jgi:hypothetical protein